MLKTGFFLNEHDDLGMLSAGLINKLSTFFDISQAEINRSFQCMRMEANCQGSFSTYAQIPLIIQLYKSSWRDAGIKLEVFDQVALIMVAILHDELEPVDG